MSGRQLRIVSKIVLWVSLLAVFAWPGFLLVTIAAAIGMRVGKQRLTVEHLMAVDALDLQLVRPTVEQQIRTAASEVAQLARAAGLAEEAN